VYDYSQAEYFEVGEESRAVPRADLR